jgi:molecular chaperone GrpE
MDEDEKQQEEQKSESVTMSVDPEIEQLQADLLKAKDGWMRAVADFENYKRRKENENKELVEFAREVTVAKLLPTLDSLGQALKHMPQIGESDKSENLNSEFPHKYKNWQSGVNGIVIQLDKTLAELGVKKIETIGKKFDPNFHEALREVESDKDDGIIVEEFQTGFELNGKVIRPSQVVISKKK